MNKNPNQFYIKQEVIMSRQEIINSVQEIYIGLLGRAADNEGLNYWADEIENNILTIEQVRANIVNEQIEYAQGIGAPGTSREALVTALYRTMFNREPDAEGLEYWVSGGGSTVNADQLVLALTDGASAEDRIILDNRVAISNYYTENASFNIPEAVQVLTIVDATSASILNAELEIASNAFGQGVVKELTANVDLGVNFAGTDENDTYFAITTDNLNLQDTIDGGAGVDTINILTTGDDDVIDIQFAGLRNIEVLTTTVDTVKLAGFASRAGLEQINLLNNADESKSIDITGFDSDLVINGASNIAIDTLTLSLNDSGDKSAVLGGGQDVVVVTNVPLATDLSFNSAFVGNGRFNDVIINGPNGDVYLDDEGITIGANLNDGFAVNDGQARGNFKTVILGTASADSFSNETGVGNIYTNTGAGDDILTVLSLDGERHMFVTGSGNDVVNVNSDSPGVEIIDLVSGTNAVNYADTGLTLNTDTAANNDQLIGGSGRDTLSALSAQLQGINNTLANAVQSISGFEALTVTDAQTTTTLVTSNIQAGIDTVSLNGTQVDASNITFDGGVASTLNLGAVAIDSITVASAGDGDSDQVTIANTRVAGDNAFNGQDIVATGVETLVINSNANGAAAEQTLKNVTTDDLVNFVGSNQVTVEDITAGSVNASGLSGENGLFATTSAMDVVGSDGIDDLALTANLGEDSASFDIGGGDDLVDLNITNGIDGSVVLDMGEGDDVLTLLSSEGMASNNTRLTGGADDDTLAMTARMATEVTTGPNAGFGFNVSSFETIDIGQSIVWAGEDETQTTTVDFEGMQDVETISIDGTDAGRTETATLTLEDLGQNQSITVAGVTLTAVGGTASASNLAAKIASLSNGQTYAETTVTGNIVARGTFSGWSSSALDINDVLLESLTLETNVTNLDPIESTEVLASEFPAITQSGTVSVTETSTITFEDLKFGQSITIGGRTVTNTGWDVIDREEDGVLDDVELTATAEQVAAAFALSGTELRELGGNALGSLTVVGGVGQFTGVALGNSVTFTANTPSENVTDLKETISGNIAVLAPDAPIVDIIEGDILVPAQTESTTIQIDPTVIGLGQTLTFGGVTVTRIANGQAPERADLINVFNDVYDAAYVGTTAPEGGSLTNGVFSLTLGAFTATARNADILGVAPDDGRWNFTNSALEGEEALEGELVNLIATSSIVDVVVDDIELGGSSVTLNNAASVISRTDGRPEDGSNKIEVQTITFSDMVAGQSVEVGGIKLTALVDKSDVDVAAAWVLAYDDALLTNVSVDPVDKGVNSTWYQDGFIVNNQGPATKSVLTKWAAGDIDAADGVVTLSTGANGNQNNVGVGDPSSSGINAYVAALDSEVNNVTPVEPGVDDSIITDANILTVQGVSPGVNVLFSDLVAGQSVTVAGVTVTAVGNATAANVAFAISGGTVTADMNVIVSGVLVDWTVSQIVSNPANVVTFSSEIPGQDVVEGLGISSSGADETLPVIVDTVEGVNTGFTFNNVESGVTVELTNAITEHAHSFINVENAADQNNDSLTLQLNGSSNILNAGTLTVSDVETINIVTTDSTDGSNPTAHSTLSLIANDATSVVVAGNHGVDFTGSELDDMTSFNSTGVVGTSTNVDPDVAATEAAIAGAITLTTTRDGNVNIQLGNGDAYIDTTSAASDKVVTISSTGGNTLVGGKSRGDVDFGLNRNFTNGDFVTLLFTDELGNAIGSDFRVTAATLNDGVGFATQIRNSIALEAAQRGIQGTFTVADDLSNEVDVNYLVHGRYFLSIVNSSFTADDIDREDNDGQYATDLDDLFTIDEAFEIAVGGNAQHIITLNGGTNTIRVDDQSDVITINNSLANTIDANGGNNTINVEGSGEQIITTDDGIDSITVRGTGLFSVDTGGGNDTVTILGSGDGAIYTGLSSNDTVIAGTGDTTIRTGTGDDVINITAGGNDFVQVGREGGINTIIGFNAGESIAENTDKLGFANHSNLIDLADNLLSGDETISETSNIYKLVNGSSTLDFSKIVATTDATAANGELVLSNQASAIVLQASSDSDTSFNVYHVYDDNSSIFAVTPEARLIGVVSLVDSTFGDLEEHHFDLLSDFPVPA